MTTALEVLVEVVDALRSPTGRDFCAGVAAMLGAVIVAEMILAMF